MRLVVFGRETCAPCQQLKKVLKYKEIEFEYRDAEGQEYMSIAEMFGSIIPLTVDMTTGRGVSGYRIPEILSLAQKSSS